MWPTAISEVVEQVIRVGTVLVAAWLLIPQGVEYAAAGAAFGTFTGGCAGLLFLFLVLWFHKQRGFFPKRQAFRPGEKINILKRLILYAFPISAGSLVLPLAQVIDTVIIPQRLQVVGFTMQEATSQFGQLSGMAGTVVFPSCCFYSIYCHVSGSSFGILPQQSYGD
jgi:stage V sporulation protein B